MSKVTIDIHSYASEIDLDDLVEMVKAFAGKVEQLEEENDELREQLEEQKHRRFR
jgi:cell division septum initiation protein DivIVA